MKFKKQDLATAVGTLVVLIATFLVFNSTSNDAGKLWDIRWGYWFVLGVFVSAVAAFFWNARELLSRFLSKLPSKQATTAAILLTIVLGVFAAQNIHRQHRVLSDENSWTAMGLQMRYHQTGGVCNEGYWIANQLNCTSEVTNFKGKTFGLIQGLLFYILPSNRDTALSINLPLFLASLLLFFFALYRFLNQQWVALAATIFLGTMPILLFQAQSASTEVLYVFLLTFLLWVYSLIPPDEIRWKHLLLIIPVLGLFSGTRQETLFCFIPFALYYHSFLRQKPWHLPVFALLVIIASWPAINTMAAYRGYDFQGGDHSPQSLTNLWYNLQSNIGIMMKPGIENGLLKNPFFSAYSFLWIAGSLWLLIRMIASRKYLWGGILMILFHLQSLVILINVSGTFEIDINQRYVLIALPSFAWIMALGLKDFLAVVPAIHNPIRKHAILLSTLIAAVMGAYLTISHLDCYQANILYRNNKLLAEEDFLNTELKKLPANSIFIYSRPWQMLCSGFNAFSENTLLGWSDQEYAKWRSFSNGNIYLVRGQDGFGSVDRSSRVVGFKTTEPIERILNEYATKDIWVNSRDFGYPLTVTHIQTHKGRSPYMEGLVIEPSATELKPGEVLQFQIQRSFPEALEYSWSIDGIEQPRASISTASTLLPISSKLMVPGLHTFQFNIFAPENDTLHITQDVFANGGSVALLPTFTPVRQSQAWGTLGVNKSVEGHTLKIGHRVYQFGLGAHAAASVTYRLAGKFKRFHVTVGLDDEAACGDGALWIVRGDQRQLWASGSLTALMKDSASIDVSGVEILELETKEIANNMCDHTDWGNPWLE